MANSGAFCLFVRGQKLAQSTWGNEPSDFRSNSPQPSASSNHLYCLHTRVQLFKRILGAVINGISPQKLYLHPSLLFLRKPVNFHIIACIMKTIPLSLGTLSGYCNTGNCAISMQEDAIILYSLSFGPMSFPMAQAETPGMMIHKNGNGLSSLHYPLLIGEYVYSHDLGYKMWIFIKRRNVLCPWCAVQLYHECGFHLSNAFRVNLTIAPLFTFGF